nr:MAG TPA: hypothetical protein [Caudoviricetes sp.]
MRCFMARLDMSRRALWRYKSTPHLLPKETCYVC